MPTAFSVLRRVATTDRSEETVLRSRERRPWSLSGLLARSAVVGSCAAALLFAIPAADATTTPLTITTTSLPTGDAGVAYGTQLEASGGDGPYSWSTNTPLPAGLTLRLRGPLTGTPSVAFDALITVTVTNAAGIQASSTLTLDIAPALTIATTSLSSPVVGTAYSAELQASGGTAPYSWSVTSGPLPLGLVLTSTGALSGIPGTVATTTTALTVTDAVGARTGEQLTITVAAAPSPPASYYVVTRTGTVSAYASPGVNVAQTDEADPAGVVAIAADAAGDRYWTVSSNGLVVPTFGAPFYGSVGKMHLVGVAVGIAALPTGNGYYVVSSTGHVYGFGAAHSFGSVARKRLVGHIVGIALNAFGTGYWLATSTGRVYAFGTAHLLRQRGRKLVAKGVVGIAPDPGTSGYWLVTRTGRVYAFGNAPPEGSVAANLHLRSIVGIAPLPEGGGYWVVNGAGVTFSFGAASPLTAVEAGAGAGVVAIASTS